MMSTSDKYDPPHSLITNLNKEQRILGKLLYKLAHEVAHERHQILKCSILSTKMDAIDHDVVEKVEHVELVWAEVRYATSVIIVKIATASFAYPVE